MERKRAVEWTRRLRSMRARRRPRGGVSPIVGTILLVAITVALAVVLWVALSSLTKVSASIELPSAIALDAPIYNSAGPGCPSGSAYCYWVNISIQSVQDGLTAGSLAVGWETSGGSAARLANETLLIQNVKLSCDLVSYDFTTGAWSSLASSPNGCTGGSASTPLSSYYTFLFASYGPESKADPAGLVFYLFGQNGFTGSVSVPISPS